jgi:hypothetical protein
LRRRYFEDSDHDDHPLGVRRRYDDPADVDKAAAAANRKWTFGVAAGALLVAGTFAAGALGLNSDVLPGADESAAAPEHAPTAPGHDSNGPDGNGDIGTPAVAAPPHGDQDTSRPADRDAAGRGAAANGQQGGAAQARPAPARPAPAPAPAPAPSPAPAPQPGPVERVVTPVTDTVGDVTRPVTDAVGGLVKPLTGTLSGGGDQPAMTMINPLSDLLGN